MPRTPEDIAQFERTWANPTGLRGFFTEVNNQPIGKRFMITSFAFFLIGGLMALLMRVQLAVSENDFLTPQFYNELFTMHGSTMMYLFAVPFLEGLALYLIPLMIGSRDVAFPRLSAFSYWMYLFGGLTFYASFIFGGAPDTGWFAYTPLSGPRFAGKEQDFWLLGLSMVEIAGIGAGIEIVVTILKMRAPGMGLNRIPLFAWAVLSAGVMIIFAFTVLLLATLLLEMDRALGTHFFDVAGGGNSLLWQHLFWFFGHPEVYIIFLPATGIVSAVVPVFSQRPIAGYTLVAVAIVVTAFMSFGLWVHHMYATGLPTLSMNFFAAASLMIAIATGVQVFAWIATMWGARPSLKTPMLYILGFLFIFVLGGLTGVMVAIVPFDWQVHDTFFIVAHLHYVLIGGMVFPVIAGLHMWLPKITGRMMSERAGVWSFWLVFIGFNLTFFPMHIMGFLGMPRRVYTYSPDLQLDWYNIVSTVGAFMTALGFGLFVLNYLHSLIWGREAPDNPWNGDSLEWTISSPPPSYSFRMPPLITALHEAWRKRPEIADATIQRARVALEYGPHNWRGNLVTNVVNARPQAIQYLPGPTPIPLITALALFMAAIGVLLEYYLFSAFFGIVTAGAAIAWLRPKQAIIEKRERHPIAEEAGMPTIALGTRSTAWWGNVSLLTCMATAMAAMIYSYFFLRLMSPLGEWPQQGLPLPEVVWPAFAFGALLVSSAPMWWAKRHFWRGNKRQMQIGLVAATILALAWLVLQYDVMYRLPFWPQSNAYASLFYVITWLQTLYVIAAIALNVAAQVRIVGHHDERRGFTALQMQITTMFWHFTVLTGLAAFATLYLSPHLL